jgi:hypothetical protein
MKKQNEKVKLPTNLYHEEENRHEWCRAVQFLEDPTIDHQLFKVSKQAQTSRCSGALSPAPEGRTRRILVAQSKHSARR